MCFFFLLTFENVIGFIRETGVVGSSSLSFVDGVLKFNFLGLFIIVFSSSSVGIDITNRTPAIFIILFKFNLLQMGKKKTHNVTTPFKKKFFSLEQ